LISSDTSNEEIRPGEHFQKRPDMTWRDHLVMLLHFGAEIEHSLMVQYLYCAYSLGGPQVPDEHRETVQGWRDAILTVAREEMGHLLTVQNLLTFLGAPVNFAREDFPWDRSVYPFPFTLAPFSMDILCQFIFAEMPRPQEIPLPGKNTEVRFARRSPEEENRLIAEVLVNLNSQNLKEATARAHRVGELYEKIIEVISDETKIPDSAFNEASYDYQASWDDWGRGYKPDPKKITTGGDADEEKFKAAVAAANTLATERDAYVLVGRVATRTDAVKGLRAIAGQGEGPHLIADKHGEPSHFERFLTIYEQLKAKQGDWEPARPVPRDPTTRSDFAKYSPSRYPLMSQEQSLRAAELAAEATGQVGDRLIDAIVAKHLAQIFNQRYRLLLYYLAMTYRFARNAPRDRPSLRGVLMHRAFGEMYNVKALAGMLVRLPRSLANPAAGVAAPPFEIPYTLDLPPTEREIWSKLEDLFGETRVTCGRLLYYPEEPDNWPKAPPPKEKIDQAIREQLVSVGGEAYVRTLMDLDDQTRVWIRNISACLR
jgi:hypothetical protein